MSPRLIRPRLIPPRPALLLCVALLGAGCANMPDCPEKGGPAWRQLTSEHFVLHTDMRAGKARDALQELETLRAGVLTAAFPMASRKPTGQIPVILIDEVDHWREYFPRNDGIFTHALWQPLIVAHGGNSIDREGTIKHELVHYLSRFYLPKQPRWFAEGLATYFETLETDPDAREVSFGQTQPSHLSQVQYYGILPLDTLVNGNDFSYRFQTNRFYSTSWLLVHYLANQRQQAFVDYQRSLQTMSETDAWKQVFGGPESFTGLTKALGAYLDGGRYLVLTHHFAPPPVNATELVHTDADAHVQRALLHYIGSRGQPHEAPGLGKALRDVEEALRQEPHNVMALAVRHLLLEVPVSEEAARAARRAHSQDWRAWALLSTVLQGTEAAQESQIVLKRAKTMAAHNPAVTFDVNWRPYH